MKNNIDMVSIVIGKGGFMIKQLQSRTHTTIYIESYKAGESAWSCAHITGELRDIAEAVKQIYKVIESKSSFAAFNAKVKAAVLAHPTLEQAEATTVKHGTATCTAQRVCGVLEEE